MPDKCKDHSGFCEKLENVVETQKSNKIDAERWQDKMELMISNWHGTINTELKEMKTDIKGIKEATDGMKTLWDRVKTDRVMIYSSYSMIGVIIGYFIYHISQR